MATTGNFIRDAIVAKSDQLNADALIAGNMVIKVVSVRHGNKEQPVVIHYEGDNGQPFKPCKSMVRLIAAVWGLDAPEWVGRQMELYLDPTVMYGGVRVGGIRIKSMSHIDKMISVMLTKTRGKKAEFVVFPLQIGEKQDDGNAMQKNEAMTATLIDAASKNGSAGLRAALRALSEHDRQLFDGGTCPQKIKDIAQAADNAAANAENSENDSDGEQQ